jgi:hypothetical protein
VASEQVTHHNHHVRLGLPGGQGAGAEGRDEGVVQDRGQGGHARDSRDPAKKRKTCSGG